MGTLKIKQNDKQYYAMQSMQMRQGKTERDKERRERMPESQEAEGACSQASLKYSILTAVANVCDAFQDETDQQHVAMRCV